MRAGIVFVIAVVLLGGLAVADLTVLGEGSRSGFDYGGAYANADRAVLARSVVMAPGDRLVVGANLLGGWPEFVAYELHVVPGGDRFALLEGREPRATYAVVRGMSTQGCCPAGDLVLVRPDDVLAHRAPRAAAEGGTTPEQFRAMEEAALDQPDRIDLVWVFSYSDRATRPTTAEERADIAQDLEAAQQRLALFPSQDPGYPTVYQASVAWLHPVVTWTMAGLALVAAASALAWGYALRRARVDTDGPETESLLRLYDTAGLWLASLRDLLLGSLVVLLAVALHVALLGEPGTVYALARRAELGLGATLALKLALMLAYSAVVVAWGYAVWTAQRALQRWRARRARPPLDLA